MRESARCERIAHRGAPRERLENTLPGFLLALERGADAVELDVHVTVDGQVVVHHDAEAGGRTLATTAWGDVRAIELRGGERIPLLEEVLTAVGERATVYIEMKGASAEDRVIAVARTHGRRFAIHSFDHDCIARIARLAPEVPRGLLIDKGERDALEVMKRSSRMTGARDVWPHWTLVDAELVAAARALGVRVLPWTVNAAGDARRLMALGVDGVCTDDIRVLATV